MACGWTPDLMRMLEKMQGEKEKLAEQATMELTQTTQQIEQTKKKMNQVEQKEAQSSTYDWTSIYERWDVWEDPEELACREREAREKQERAAQAARNSCNHDHSAEQKLMDMSTTDKLHACTEFRLFGNLFFSQGQYQRAAYHYHKAIIYFEYVFPDTEEEENDFQTLKLTTLLNYAACRLKTGHIDDALHHADLALELDPDNIKALYRRAQAHRYRDEFEQATKDLTQAMAVSTTIDPLLIQEKALLQAKILAYQLKSKQLSTAMFGSKTPDIMSTTEVRKPTTVPTAKDMQLLLSTTTITDHTPHSHDMSWDDTVLSMESIENWRPSTVGLYELEEFLKTI